MEKIETRTKVILTVAPYHLHNTHGLHVIYENRGCDECGKEVYRVYTAADEIMTNAELAVLAEATKHYKFIDKFVKDHYEAVGSLMKLEMDLERAINELVREVGGTEQ